MDSTHDDKTLELAIKAAAGDSGAEEILVSEFSILVRACARPYFLAGADSEDLIQEGMLGLLSAIRTFNPNKGAKFSTYAEFCVRRRIYSAIKEASGNKHSPLNSYISLESPQSSRNEISLIDSGTPVTSLRAPEDLIIAREQVGEIEKLLYGALSRFESGVLELYLEGMSYKDMAVRLNKPDKSVDNAVQRIRKKLSSILMQYSD